MLLAGLLLLCASGAVTALLISYNHGGGPDYSVMMFGHKLGTFNTLTVFIAGLALSMLFCIGYAMMAGHIRRARRLSVGRHTVLDDETVPVQHVARGRGRGRIVEEPVASEPVREERLADERADQRAEEDPELGDTVVTEKHDGVITG